MCSYLALAGASSLTTTSCSSESEPDSAPVTLQISYIPGAEAQLRSDKSVFSLALPTTSNATKFDEVTRIVVDVKDDATDLAHYVNFDLTRINANTWQGELPSLPRDVQLEFLARATNSAGELAFSGQTLATLATGGQDVVIPLASVQNNMMFPMPRMLSIVYPSAIRSGEEEQFAFTIQGTAGAAIGVRITPNGSTTPAAAFSPATGTVTLLNTVASFVSSFTAPPVTADTQLDYQITITAAGPLSSVAITTNFRVTVKPPGSGIPAVDDTRPTVLFNPVILALNANGSAVPGTVELSAEVSDDGPASELSYQWSYAPAQGSPAGTFTNAALNPALFEGYQSLHQGEIKLEVTDGNNGTTTLRYPLTTHQFDNAIDHGSVNGIKRIVSGGAHTCVLTGASRVRCWGDNTYGQLGYGTTEDVGHSSQRLPYAVGDVPLPPLDPVVQLAAGENHTCALLQSGLLYCWGRNNFGQLGYGNTNNLADGEAVTSFGYVRLGGEAKLIAAGGDHSCAIMESGSVRCWGYNQYGQLGRGNTTHIGDNETPASAGDLNFGQGVTVKDLALGGLHTCAIFTNGAMRCWGYNGTGQLGYGSSAPLGDDEALATIPNVSVTGAIRKVVAGTSHTCALTDVGTLRCWGYNQYGQLGQSPIGGGLAWGDNVNELPSTLPSDINTGSTVTDVATFNNHVCALSNDGKLKCWGYNGNGQLGTGGTSSLGAPPANGVDLGGVTAYRISTGAEHSCALRSNGTTRCWGLGAEGRLGRGSTTSAFTPNADTLVFQPTP